MTPRVVMRTRRYADNAGHGSSLAGQVTHLAAVHLQRRATLGVDPSLVVTIAVNRPVDPAEFGRAGLRVVDDTREPVVIAFADDPQLAAFNERLQRYRTSPVPEKGALPFEAFFDAIEGLQAFGPADRVTPRLNEAIASGAHQDFRLDIECWHSGDRSEVDRWQAEVRKAVEAAGGRVADQYVNHTAGLVLNRVYVPSGALSDLAQLDQVARMDLLPQPELAPQQLYRMEVKDLPKFDAAADDAPILAVIDSGVRSGHPLIAPGLFNAVTLSGEFPTALDGAGHGTHVAALALHGPLDAAIASGFLPRPLCRILAIRLLDDAGNVPNETLYEKDLEESIRYAADAGARVVNLSIGDRDTIYRGPRSTPVAALLDQLARELGIVIVVPTGNVHVASYSDVDEDLVDQYPSRLVASDETRLLDPAPAALALTVGGLVAGAAAGGLRHREVATLRPMGQPGWPSPFTRRGPGIGGAVKPELSAPAGSLAVDLAGARVVDDAELSVVSAAAKPPERLLAVDSGTSFAAPIVSRAASAVLARYPEASANLVRALVLQAVKEPLDVYAEAIGSVSERRQALRNLVGYGECRVAEACQSSDYRAVMIAEAEIPPNGVHIYRIPIPPSFFESGGERGMTIAFAFDPATRCRRLDYLASRMDFQVVRGMDPDEAAQVFMAMEVEQLEAEEAAIGDPDDDDSAGDADDLAPPQPSALGSRLIRLEPSTTTRSRGANQLGRIVFKRRFNPDHEKFLLIVKNTNRWAPDGDLQQYAVAVTLWRDAGHGPLYADLRAELSVELEAELAALEAEL